MKLSGPNFFLFFLTLFSFFGASPALAGMEAPAVMILVGTVSASPSSAIRPASGSRVLAFSTQDGQLVGDGEVSASGAYVLVIGRQTSFNGTPVVLELQQQLARYTLLQPSAERWVRFAGRTFPERTIFNWVVGQKSTDLTEAEAATPQAQRLSMAVDAPCDVQRDVNRDGRCDENDWAILRLYGGGVSRVSPGRR